MWRMQGTNGVGSVSHPTTQRTKNSKVEPVEPVNAVNCDEREYLMLCLHGIVGESKYDYPAGKEGW